MKLFLPFLSLFLIWFLFLFLFFLGHMICVYYMFQVRECNIPLNTCLFGAADPAIASVLTEIAANSGGRYIIRGKEDREIVEGI